MGTRGQAQTDTTVNEAPEPRWVKNTRNAAGVASILGIVAVSLFAFDHLLPWWKETIESDRRQREGTPPM